MKLRYLEVKKDKLLYRRRVPIDIERLVGKSSYYKTLPCHPSDSEESIAKAWTQVHEEFQTLVDVYRNNFPEEILEEQVKREAVKYLSANGMKPGTGLSVAYDESDLIDYSDSFEGLYKQRLRFEEWRNSNYEDIRNMVGDNLQKAWALFLEQNPETPQEKILHEALRLYVDTKQRKIKQKRLLSECWDVYNSLRGEPYDVTNREGQRAYRRWTRLLDYAGECLVEDVDSIHEALDRLVEERSKEVSPATVKKDLGQISAVLNKVYQKDKLQVRITLPPLKSHTEKNVPTLSQTDQIQLVEQVVNGECPPDVGVAILLFLQGAMINSELQRLRTDSLRLDDSIPHITIAGKTKTQERKRNVPITVGVAWLRKAFKELDDGSGYAMGAKWARASDTTTSKRVNSFLSKYSEEEDKRFTGYSLRHSFKANSMAHNASDQWRYIGGWKNRETKVADAYARDAVSQEAVLKGFQECSKVINKHLIAVDNHLKLVKEK